jgi:hypothetical protein
MAFLASLHPARAVVVTCTCALALMTVIHEIVYLLEFAILTVIKGAKYNRVEPS